MSRAKDATKIVEGVHDYMTMLPQVYNCDSLGYRPDLVGRPVTQWKDLYDPKFKGKAAILDVPNIGIMDAAIACESRGIDHTRQGQHDAAEIDKTINALIALKKAGQFRAIWTTFDQIGRADGLGRGGDPVDVVAGGDRGAGQGHPLHLRAVNTPTARKAIAAGATAWA